jgi:hypothetical protein
VWDVALALARIERRRAECSRSSAFAALAEAGDGLAAARAGHEIDRHLLLHDLSGLSATVPAKPPAMFTTLRAGQLA